MLLSNMLPDRGNGSFMISAFARALDGTSTLLGSKPIVCANATATKPFGTIDTPKQGETVSGTIVNFGWALTPWPKMIPPDGSTIEVLVDGIVIGHAAYGFARSDIQSLFPGYANTDGAIGYFILDTRTMSNGVHAIAWIVRDNTGATEGIGSRYFTVSNGGL